MTFQHGALTHPASEPRILGRTAAWCVVVRFGEVALKKGNRPWFMRRLRDNVERALGGLPVSDVTIRPNRCLVHVHDVTAWETIRARLASVFGVTGYSLALEVPNDLDAMKEAYDVLAPESPSTFRVRVKRADKRFPLTSQEIERDLGRWILDRTGARVDLDHGELTYGVEVQQKGAFCFVERDNGPGGLPVGTAGRVAVLLSGGIDSPVAAYRTMKRGCVTVFVHFTSFPYTDASSVEKSRTLTRDLTRFQYKSKLYVVPLGEVQQRIVVVVPARYRILTYRRMMLRIAQDIARRENCQALVTGESIGQVGSQTLQNLASLEKAVDLPVLRPLIGMDKQEIIADARRIGTYETSIEPDMDCCQFLVPPRVAVRSTPETLTDLEQAFDVDELRRLAIAGCHVETFSWPEA